MTDTNAALQQIGHGFNNLHASFLAHQKNSEHRWSHMQERMDNNHKEICEKLTHVCDKGGMEHQEFRDAISEIRLRIATYEARSQGHADILKPIFGWAVKNWAVVLLVAYMGWDVVAKPMIAQATQPRSVVRLSEPL